MEEKIKKSLRYSIGDGAFYFLMVGCGEIGRCGLREQMGFPEGCKRTQSWG